MNNLTEEAHVKNICEQAANDNAQCAKGQRRQMRSVLRQEFWTVGFMKLEIPVERNMVYLCSFSRKVHIYKPASGQKQNVQEI